MCWGGGGQVEGGGPSAKVEEAEGGHEQVRGLTSFGRWGSGVQPGSPPSWRCAWDGLPRWSSHTCIAGTHLLLLGLLGKTGVGGKGVMREGGKEGVVTPRMTP